MKSNPRILVIGPAWVGDMIMAQSLFTRLKQLYPQCVIDVLAPAWTFALLDRMPQVNQALKLDFKHGEFKPWQRFKFGRGLKQHYDWAIVLPNSWKSAIIPFSAKVPVRTGWLGEFRYGLLNDARKLDREQYPKMVQRFAALAQKPKEPLPESLPKPRLTGRAQTRQSTIDKFGLNQRANAIVLCPGAEFGPSKRWPADYFAALGERLVKSGYEIWLMGSPNDLAVSESVKHHLATGYRDFTGRTGLDEAIELMTLADGAVTNDSGLMHIASALDLTLVALYGSSSPDFTPPLTDKARIINQDLECSPCFKRNCPLGHHRCMRSIESEYVCQTLLSSLEDDLKAV